MNSSSKHINQNNQINPDSAPENNLKEHLTEQINKKMEMSSHKDRRLSPTRAMSSAPPVKTLSLEANAHPPILDGYNIHIDGGLKKLSKIAVHEISNIFGGAIDPVFQNG